MESGRHMYFENLSPKDFDILTHPPRENMASLGLKKGELDWDEGAHRVLGEFRSSDGDKWRGVDSQKRDDDKKHIEVKEDHSWMSLLSI